MPDNEAARMNNSQVTLLKTESLAVGYENLSEVLSSVNLTISSGTITAIIGPNGSGKSTLLKTLARQLKPLSGTIQLNNKNVWEMSAREFSRHCSFVPQFMNTAAHLTVGELIALGRNPHQSWWSWNQSVEDRKAIQASLQKTSMETLKDRYLATLSGGEKQRALIASALAQDARFILMDEPVSSLDFKHQLSIIQLVQELKQMNIAVVVVLHDLNIVDAIADSVVMIKEFENKANEIVIHGKPEDVLTRELIKEVFEVEVEIMIESGKRFFNLMRSST